MRLDKNKFINDYLCCSTLVIQNDSEYGYHIYFRHGYKDIEFSYYTSYEDLDKIISELLDMVVLLEK